MQPTIATITFLQNGVSRTLDLLSDDTLSFFTKHMDFEEEYVRVVLEPKKAVEISEIKLQFPCSFEREDSIFMNGFQSWTVCKEYNIDTTKAVMEQMAKILKHAPSDHCGDRAFTDYPKQNRWLHGVSYGYIRREGDFRFFGSLSEHTGFTFFDIDTDAGILTVRKDLQKRIFAETIHAFDLLFLKGTEDEVFDRYFRELKIEPAPCRPITGYTTWYRHQQDISEKKLLADIKEVSDSASKYPCSVFFIDEGYENAVGDWLTPKKNYFPHGVAPLVKKILSSHMKAGIWIAPFICDKKSEIYKHHRDWLLRDSSGDLVPACRSWKDCYCIDVENLAFRHHMKNVLLTMRDDWGISYFKFDFLFAACLLPSPTKTRGEKMMEAIHFLKSCVGHSVTIACAVPLISAAGHFDYCQVSCDYSPDWYPALTMANREQNSTYRATVDTIMHRQLAGRAFSIFNNVTPISSKAFLFDSAKRSLLARVQGLTHGMILTSDELSKFTAEDTVLWNTVQSFQDATITKVYTQGHDLIVEYELYTQPQKLCIPLLE